MTKVFLSIINMSISASWVLLIVLVLRLLLKKAPKWIAVVLWGVVAIRLICPISLESIFSLIPSAETVSPDIMTEQIPTINTGIPIINSTLNPVIGESFTPIPGASSNPLQIWIPILTSVWIAGVAMLFGYMLISYIRVKRRIGTAILYRDNIWQSENVVSPFVLGLIKPKIFLPFSMRQQDMDYVLAHEQAHIRRKDHLWKPVGFLLLALHWFNPLMWLGYVLLCRDIELACDEKVIKELDYDARADYSQALLTCSVNRRVIAACPLAFGEVGVKERVKSVLNYKKPAFWIIIGAIVICIVVAVCFLTNPPQKPDNPEPGNAIFTEYEGVYLSIDIIDLNAKGHNIFSLILYNNSDKQVTYGDSYSMERKNGKKWVNVELDVPDSSDSPVYGYTVNPERIALLTATTEDFDVSREGIYRLVVPFCVDGEIWKTWVEFKAEDLPKTSMLQQRLPQFFNLNMEEGLVVYDWRSSGGSHCYYLVTEEMDRLSDQSYAFAEFAYEYELCEILATYNDIDNDKIRIVPVKNPLSSYEYEITDTYRAQVENHLQNILNFVSQSYTKWPITVKPNWLCCDMAIFDVDNDGVDEICVLADAMLSGLSGFTFRARDVGSNAWEYTNIFYGPREAFFQKSTDGIMRVKVGTSLCDITIKDGRIQLFRDGVQIGLLH